MEKTAYNRTETMKGRFPVRNIFRTLAYSLVSVNAATRLALEEVGEHRSPKYAPEMMAPAARFKSTWPLLAKTINTTPIVPKVPKLVPRMKETRQVSKNARRMKKLGLIHFVP